MMTDSHRGLRRLSILGTAILVLIAGVLVYLGRSGASVRAPEPRHSEYARVGPEEQSEKIARPAVPPAANATEIDPLESTRHAPPVAKGPVKSNAMATVSSPIAATAGSGPDRFVIRDRNVSAFFTNRGVTLAMISTQDPSMSGYAMRWGLDGAAPVEPQPKGELPGKINRLIGDSSQWQTNQSSYSKIVYPDVKPGVDLTVESLPHALKYTVNLAAGVDPAALQFKYEGATDVEVGTDGASLDVLTSDGVMVENGLQCWQDGPQGRVPVAARYVRTAYNGYAIRLDAYDPKLPLTVDPVFAWGTFLGGTKAPSGGDDYGMAIVVDQVGTYTSYVAGYTYSVDYPVTAGAYQTTRNSLPDAFVTRMDTNGTMIWSTLLGGSSTDVITAIKLDSAQNVIVAGYTYSQDLFPIGLPGRQPTPVGTNQMAFIAKLNSTGTGLLWGNYLGGNNTTSASALAVDTSNNVYVTGYTYATNFPTVNPGQGTLSTGADAFVTKYSSDGLSYIFSTYFGQTTDDRGTAIAVDTSFNVYVAGTTNGPFYNTMPFKGTAGSTDCFVSKLAPAGNLLVWSTLIGGASDDHVTGIGLDTSVSPPNVVICGYSYKSSSTATDYPTVSAFQPLHNASYDAFVTKLNSAGTSMVFSTYLGGSNTDYAYGVDCYPGSPNDIYVGGYTYSTDFPTFNAFQGSLSGGSGTDCWVARFSGTGSLGFSSYFGGTGNDNVQGVAQSGGWVWITGNTTSLNYPSTAGVFSTTLSGSSDAFVTRVNPYNSGASVLAAPCFSTYLGGAHQLGNSSTSNTYNAAGVDPSGAAVVVGTSYAIDYPTTALARYPAFIGTQTNIVVSKIKPDGTGLVWSTFLGGSNYQYPNAIGMNSTGGVYVTGYTGSPDFPTVGAGRLVMTGSEDAFVTHVKNDGTSLVFSSFLGGSTNSDYGYAVAVDSTNNVYVAGDAYSTDFPTTGGVVKTALGGGGDGFVMKLNSSGGTIWSTLLGGNVSQEHIQAIAVDPSGAPYVTGYTYSSDYPITGGAYSNVYDAATGNTLFVTKLNPTATGYGYSTFLGGSNAEYPYSIAVDPNGSAYVAGYTYSANFPVFSGAQMLMAGNADGFVTKFNPAGNGLVWSTFLGGSDYDYIYALGLDAALNVYVTGYTQSTNFPVSASLFTTYAGNGDAFATRINAAGNSFSWSTYLGGTSSEQGRGVSLDANGNVYIVGYTSSKDFPVTAGAFSTQLSGSTDIFVARINNEAPSIPGSLSQYRSNGTTVIATGGSTNETTVILKGVSADPEGDQYKIQVEVRSDVTAFTSPATVTLGTAFFESPFVPSGTTATVTVTGRTPGVRYHWQARSVDAAGVASAWVSYGGNTENPPTNPAAIDFRVDQTFPSVAIVSPTGSGTFNTNLSTVALSGTASDDVALFNVTWSNAANATNGTATGTTSWSIASISLVGGSNNITVAAQDTAGNVTITTINVIQDASPPSITITVPTSNPTTITATSPLTLGATANDNIGVSSVTWANATNSTGGSASLSAGLWSTTPITLVNGINNITMTAFDAAGNSANDTIAVTYDPTPPVVTVTTPTPASTFSTNLASVTLGGTASDAITSVTLVQYLNTTTGSTLTTASGTNNWTTGSILLAAGTNVIHVVGTDSAGNTTTVTVNVIFDNSPPSINITAPTAGSTYITNSSTVSMIGTASDSGGAGLTSVTWANPATAGSGTATGTTSWSIPTIGLNTGSNAITVTATDGAGNTASRLLTVTYDPTAPSVAFTLPASTPTFTTATSANISGTASDNVALAAVDFRNNGASYAATGGTLASWSVSNIPLVAGSNTIDVRATDTAGNTFVKTVVINRDNTPPAISIVSPGTNPFYTTAASIAMSGTASDASGVSVVDYQIGAGPFNSASGTTSWSISSVSLSAGSNTVTVRATDVAGNQTSVATTIIQDTVLPSVAITTGGGLDFATNTTPLALAGTASDNFVVSSVQWQNNGGAFSAAAGTTSWNASIPLAAGANNIVVKAIDAAGNIKTTGMTVTLDQTNPVVTITAPTSLASYSTAATPLTTLAGTASDNVALASVQWRVNGAGFAATSGSLTSWNVPSIPLNPGSNTVDVKATDTAGNSFTKTLTVILDTTPPSATITTPATNPAFTASTPIAMSGTASDNNAVALVEWRVVPGLFAAASGTTAWSVPSIPLVAGSNTIEIRVTDAAGNPFVTSTNIILDNTPPSVAITTPSTNPFVTNATPLALSGTASDGGAPFIISQIQWQNNGGAFNTAVGTTSWSASVPLAAGSNAIVVRATDGAGNQTTTSINVTYSTTAPVVNITSPTASSTYVTGSNSIVLGGTATSGPGLQKMEYRVLPAPGFTQFAPPGATSPWTTPSLPLAVGANTIEIRATDTASNTATSSITVTYDNVAPTLAITFPTSASTYQTNATSVTLGGTVSDSGGGTVATVGWSNAGGPTSGTANIAGGNWTSSTPIPLVPGSQVITVTATDSVGNSSIKTITVNLDQTPPAVSITVPATTPSIRNNTPLPVTFLATDAGGSGVATVSWSRAEGGGASGSAVFSSGSNWTANVPLVAGTNTITPSATDVAGNSTTGSAIVVVLDQTNPNLAITSPTATPNYSTKLLAVALSGTVSDGGGGSVQSVTWSTTGAVSPTSGTATLNPGTWSVASINLAVGTQTITVTATDTALNTTSKTLTVICDTASATVSITVPATSPTVRSTTPVPVTFLATNSGGSGVASVGWSRAEGGGASGSAVFVSGSNWTANIPLVAGTNTITPSATTGAGTVSTGPSVTVILDQTGPTLAITAPAPAPATVYTNSGASTLVGLAGTVSDTGGGTVASVSCSNPSVPSTTTATVSGGTWTADAPISLVPGSQDITVTATDSVGNVSTATLTVILDTQAPTISVTNPPAPYPFVTGTNPLNVGGTASDVGLAGVKNVTWVNQDTTALGAVISSGTASGTTNWSASVGLSAVVTHNFITFTATDNAGNSSSTSITVDLNASAPTISISTPTTSSTFYTSGGSVTVTGTAAAAGVATLTKVEYSINGGAFSLATGTAFWTTPSIPLSGATTTIVMRATDNSALTSSDTLTVVQDLTAPTISISTNGGASFSVNSSPVLLAGTAGDVGGSSLTSVTWVNGATSGTGSATGLASWTASVPLTPGANLITFTATDGAGNTNAAPPTTITITYDVTSPVVNILAPSSTGSFQTANPSLATLAGTATDNISVSQVQYQINGGAFTAASFSSPPNWTVPPISLSSGVNTIVVRATDGSGNTGTSAITVVLDNTPPTVGISIPVSPFYTNSSSALLEGTASDNLALASVTWVNAANGATGTATGTASWTAPAIPLVAGSNTITVKSTDSLGNISLPASVTVIYDSSAPTLAIGAPAAASVTKNLSITVSGTVSDNDQVSQVSYTNAANGNTGTLVIGAASSPWSFTGGTAVSLAVGTNVITVTATDRSGNSSTKLVTVTCDTTLPSVAITTPTSSPTYLSGSSPLLIGGTASDNVAVSSVTWSNSAGGSGTASGTTSWSASVALFSGLNTITVTATDTAGNIQTGVIAVTLDSSSPTVAITTPATSTFATNSSPIALAGTATDPASGISSVKWSNSATGGAGSATGTASWTASVPLAIGANTVTVTATSNSGITNSAVVTITLDTTAPTVTITGPTSAPTLVTPASTLALAGTTSDNVSVATVAWSTTGVVVPNSGSVVPSAGLWNVPVINLAAGSQVITVTATDTAGNTATDTITVTSDAVLPTIAITSPTNLPTYVTGGATLNIGGTAADNVAVGGVSWTRTEGSLSGSAAGTTAWSAVVPLQVGSNHFTFVATDTAGNTSLTATILVTRDTTAPAVAITAPTGLGTFFTNVTPAVLGGTATDLDGVISVTWSNAATGGSGTATYAAPNWNADVPLAIGVNTITVSATDVAANVATTTIDVTFDVTKPTVTINNPTVAASFVTGNGTLALGGTMSDNVGVTAVTWSTTAAVVPASGTAILNTGTTWSVASVNLAVGSQVLTVTALDAAGNSSSTILTVILDNTAPGVTITGPTSAASYITNAGTINLSGTASDNVAVASVSWSNSTGGSGAAVGTNSWNASVPLVAGVNTITVTATDSAGSTSTDQIAVTYDPTPPSVAITAPTAGPAFFTNSGPILLGGTASDGVGLASVKWANSATGGAGTATGTAAWTASVPLASGANPITVTATDTAGNTSTAVITVTLDTVVPSVSIVLPTPAPIFVTAATTVALSGVASDNVGVQTVSVVNAANGAVGAVAGTTSWSVASLALVAGDNPVTVTVTDTSGNTSGATITIRQDSVPPAVAITLPTATGTAFTNANSISIGGTATDNVGVASVTWANAAAVPPSGTATGTGSWSAAVPLVPGVNTIVVTATDTAGNTSTDTILVTLDTTAPTISTTGPTNQPSFNTATSSVTISGSAADVGAGLASVTWSNAATGAVGTALGTNAWSAAVALTPGINVITITATDRAGNTTTSVITVIHDTLPPTVNISAPTSAAVYNSPTSPLLVGGTASDNVGVTSVTWSNSATGSSGTAVGTTAWSVSIPLVQGNNQITVTAVDAVGNAATDTISVSYDPIAPTIGITVPTAAPTFSTTTSPLDFFGTASDNLSLASVTWVNAATAVTGTANGTTAWNATIPLSSGTNAITFTATDGVGNTSTATIMVTYDITPPVVTIVSPVPPGITTQTRPLLISGTATDNVGVANVTWSNSLTGGSGPAAFVDPNWNASIPLIPGINVITIRASDALGNIGSATFTVDYSHETVPPTIAIDSAFLPSYVSPTQLATITGTASDNVGVTSVSWLNKTTGVTGIATGTNAWVASIPLASGNNVILFTASDDVGNTATAQLPVSFAAPVESNPPNLTITAPTTVSTYTTATSPLDVQCTAIDDVGVVTVTWTNQGTFGNGTCSWSGIWDASIPLATGLNPITFTATDTSGNTATATIAVTYQPAAGDPIPPNVSIVLPAASGTVDVTVPMVDLSGTSSDNTTVAVVTFNNSATGQSASAVGTTAWSASSIPLDPGVNVITARAIDPSGNVGQSTLVVVYTPPAAAKPVAPVIPAGMCGCTGLEPLLLVGAFWLRRRLRRPTR